MREACTFAWVATAAAAAAEAAHHALGPARGGGGGGAGGGGWPRHRFPACRHATTGGCGRKGRNTTRKSGPRVEAVAESTTRERVFQGTAAGPWRGHHGRLTHPRGARRGHAGRGKISKENRLCGAPQAGGGARGWCAYKSPAADGDLEVERGVRAEPSLAGEGGPPPGVGPWDDASGWWGHCVPSKRWMARKRRRSTVIVHHERVGPSKGHLEGGGGCVGRDREGRSYLEALVRRVEREGNCPVAGACGRQG